jgi:hypothetical protein
MCTKIEEDNNNKFCECWHASQGSDTAFIGTDLEEPAGHEFLSEKIRILRIDLYRNQGPYSP